MDKREAKQRIEKLKKVISYHRYLYHVLNRQEISSEALDSLKHELWQLEQKFPEFITPDSPTQRVAGKPSKGFKKIKHNIPMLSIEDIFSEQELQNWQDYLKRLEKSEEIEYFCELKIDGFAISLVYKNGSLVYGATRGDGKIGEDVTQNLKTIESIPLKLNLHNNIEVSNKIKKLISSGRIEVRGEVYMEKKNFEKINQERKKQGLKIYANPRNTAAGTIRQLDPKIVASRHLKFLAYDTDIGQETHLQKHKILSLIGFKSDKGLKCKDLQCIIQFRKDIIKKRDALPFQIDGIVINVNNNSLFQKLGRAGKSPRGIRAFKFSPKQATTIVRDIRVQVGRTGAITPIAVLKPVKISGATITRATLHNQDEIKKLGVKIGDTVIIERSGDVIPSVVNVLSKLRTEKEKEFHFPRFCPVCKTKLTRPEGEVIWRCLNIDCQIRKRENLHYFVSKKAFNIKGLGPKAIDKLVDENLISQVSDIFELKQGDLIPLERFAEKSAKNLMESIQGSKTISLPAFIYSLGIRHVGEETAINISQYFSSINNLRNSSKQELEKVPDIGPKVSESICSWFKEKKNQQLIKDLLKLGVKVINQEIQNNKLRGKNFVFTGSLKSLTREEARKKIRMLGGHPTNSLSKYTDFLVFGENPSSKIQKAKELGVKIIKEKEFLKLIK
ncbi:MAG TPA: NAD-dependent DNA ligase LigA [bacterium]|nr:NAD-dependent DNA ligase LigA [bacterium]